MASQGDPRVLLVMNLVLSFAFAYLVVWGLSFVDVLEFAWRTVGVATVALVVITYLVTMR